MLDADDDPLEEVFARARDRAERFELSLGHLRSGGPAFAEASALYPWDMAPQASGAAAMRLQRMQPGDVIKASIKGRTGIWGKVTEIKQGVVYFRPLCPATGWHHASARDVVGHWRKAGRRGAGAEDDPNTPAVVSKEQLSLPGAHT